MVAAVNASTKKEFGCGFISASSMPNKRKGYLPGGTMQLIRGTIFGQYTKCDGEKYGRYTWMKVGRKNDNKLCISTAYRVIQEKDTQPTSENCNTSY